MQMCLRSTLASLAWRPAASFVQVSALLKGKILKAINRLLVRSRASSLWVKVVCLSSGCEAVLWVSPAW